MTDQRLRGVIFDLDGTLYHLRQTRAQMTLRLLPQVGVLRYLDGARRAVRAKTFDGPEALSQAFAEELGRRAGISAERADRFYREHFLPTFIELLDRRAVPRPGLFPMLGRLREAGVKLGVVSDIGLVSERLQAIGIPPQAFDDLLSAEETGELKPSPRALLTLAERWQLDPDQVIVVGDRVDRDAPAASAAGMPSIVIDNHALPLGRRRKGGITLVSWKDATRTIADRTGLE